MKIYNLMKPSVWLLVLIFTLFSSCEKNLDNVVYGDLSSTVGTPQFAYATVMATYTGLVGGNAWQGGWTSAWPGWKVQAMESTDEGICGWGETWRRLNNLQFDPDFDWLYRPYTDLMPFLSRIAVGIDNIEKTEMDKDLKKQYIAEMKALRAHYAQILYSLYGPLTIKTDPKIASDPNAPYVPRPSSADMVKQIIADYTDAIAGLPERFSGSNYGRFTKGASLTGLMKLYMQEKRWAEAVATGEQIEALGYSLTPNYVDNFSLKNKNGANPEIIAAVVCSANAPLENYTNIWLAHVLPGDYVDPSGIPLMAWGGYMMPWKTYDKFDPADKRLKVLLQNYPVGKDANGNVIYKDSRAAGRPGAIPMKFSADGWKDNNQDGSTDFPIYRYADVLLMLAEARNEVNNGPNATAYAEINAVRTRSGLPNLMADLSKSEFLKKIQDERLFELWAEGWRRDDLLRWGLFIKRAQDDGSIYATAEKVLYPLPRSVVNQSGGVVKQNAGYN